MERAERTRHWSDTLRFASKFIVWKRWKEREREKKKTHTEGNLARKLEGIRDHRLSMRQIQSKWRKDTSCLFHSCSYCFSERNFPVSWNVIAHISGNKLRWLWVNNTRHSIDQDTPDLSVFLFSFIPLIVTFLCVFLSLLFFFFFWYRSLVLVSPELIYVMADILLSLLSFLETPEHHSVEFILKAKKKKAASYLTLPSAAQERMQIKKQQ